MLYNLPADYSIVCDAGISARAVSSNSKPDPDVLLLAVAGVGIGGGGAEETGSGGVAAKGGVVWFAAGCSVLPPCAGVAVCGVIGADCAVYDGDGDGDGDGDVCCCGMGDFCA